METVTLPYRVSVLEDGVFFGCVHLQSITISARVTYIGSLAFSGCDSLTTVTYSGTADEWLALSKGADWDIATGEYTVMCSDGSVAKDGTVTRTTA